MEFRSGAGVLTLLFSAPKFLFSNNMLALKLHWLPERRGVFEVLSRRGRSAILAG
jgi:hypothetical protein